jgi:hypothetical protein
MDIQTQSHTKFRSWKVRASLGILAIVLVYGGSWSTIVPLSFTGLVLLDGLECPVLSDLGDAI